MAIETQIGIQFHDNAHHKHVSQSAHVLEAAGPIVLAGGGRLCPGHGLAVPGGVAVGRQAAPLDQARPPADQGELPLHVWQLSCRPRRAALACLTALFCRPWSVTLACLQLWAYFAVPCW